MFKVTTMDTEVRDTDFKASQEKNGIHMTDMMELAEVEVVSRKLVSEEETGDLNNQSIRRKVKLIQKLLKNIRRSQLRKLLLMKHQQKNIRMKDQKEDKEEKEETKKEKLKKKKKKKLKVLLLKNSKLNRKKLT